MALKHNCALQIINKYTSCQFKEDCQAINQFCFNTNVGCHILELCIFMHLKKGPTYAGYIAQTYVFIVFMMSHIRTICLIKKRAI